MNDKRLHILRVTEKLLKEHGLHGLSMSKIVQAAGVSTGTIYRYFKDKHDLITAIHFESASQLALAICQDLDGPADDRQKLFTMIDNLIDYNERYPERYLTKAALDLVSQQRTHCDMERIRALFAPLTRYIEGGREKGLFKPLPTDILVSLCLGPIEWNYHLRKESFCTLSNEELLLIKQACWEAMLAPEANPGS
ncbi:TetR/AcrR family transcriptional regulator [Pokkaliibacter plantistimulans]|uniref:TetR/AcrR family transcriptional regulator n=1 Tax=Pokkaliibacter plantistimulans TaxID=1635171 RepID=UPI000D74249A|nr:TetR/AcrR family transcriptional regulator [Pokkaliibacter plantistimulans]